MRKRTVKLWRLHEDGRKLFAGTIEAADPRGGQSGSIASRMTGAGSWRARSRPELTPVGISEVVGSFKMS